MAIYAVFRALGLRIEVLPILETPGKYITNELRFGGVGPKHSGPRPSFREKMKEGLHLSRRDGNTARKLEVDNIHLDYDIDDSDGESMAEVSPT